nr:disease resistance protein TAO1-like [Quercus suber]
MKRLQKLLLGCTAIMELPSSIECLTGLNILILSGCKNLVCLPNTICSLTLLNNLDLFGCSKFDKLPEDLGNMVSLKELTLCGTAIKELPSSVEFLLSLWSLNLTDCKNFVFLPSTICSLKSLSAIYRSGCSKFVNLPENLGNLEALHTFTLEGTAIEVLPSSIGHLIALRYLSLKDCKNLVCLPSTICNLMEVSFLDLSGCSKIVNLPENLGNMESLLNLHLHGTAIKELPSSTVRLQNVMGVCFSERQWPSSPFDSLPTSLDPVGVLLRLLSSMPIRDLDLRDCHLLAIPNDIGCLSLLNALRLSGNDFISLPESISQLFRLRLLDLDGCKRLRSLPNLPTKVEWEKYGKLVSHHLGLLYLSNLHDWETPCVSIDAKEFHQVEIKIAITGFELEKIGVRLVYKDPNQTIAHDSSNLRGGRLPIFDRGYYAFS